MTKYQNVPDFPNYRVGDDGTLWTQAKKGVKTTVKDGVWSLRNPRPNPDGYIFVQLKNGKKRLNIHLHKLILQIFVGAPKDGHVACHRNDVKTDNKISNLRWATHVANCQDRTRNGMHAAGSRNGNSKLSWADVDTIRRRAALGESRAGLAREYGIGRAYIFRIIRQDAWKETYHP